MHGIRRDTFNTEKELRDLKEFISIRSYYESWKKSKDCSGQDEAGYKVTRNFILVSPDNTSVWNSRKRLLSISLKAGNKDELFELFQHELSLTFEALKRNTKSYSTWFHRRWMLQQFEQVIQPNWNIELELLSKLLDLDDRNFHAWGYRQWILSKLTVSHQEKILFTKKKITRNFSNYSAWHVRTNLLTEEMKYNNDMKNVWMQELDWIRNAYFTEPRDSSPWYYLQWLFDVVSKYCLDSSFLGCHIDQKKLQICFYHSDYHSESLSYPAILTVRYHSKEFIYNGTCYTFHRHAPNYSMSIFQANRSNSDRHFPESISDVFLDIIEGNSKTNIISFTLGQRSTMAPFYRSFLDQQRSDLLSLLNIEPDAKWAKYQLVLSNSILGTRYKESLEFLRELATKLDPVRSGHYIELESWITAEEEKNEDLYLHPILSPIKYINDSIKAFTFRGSSLPLGTFWLSGLIQCNSIDVSDSFLWPAYYPRLVYQRIF